MAPLVPTRPVAIAIMARAPSHSSGKTRLIRKLAVADPVSLKRAILLDTIAVVKRADAGDLVVLGTPLDGKAELQELAGADAHVLPQRGVDLGARLQRAFEDLFEAGYTSVIVLGSDTPTLPSQYLDAAVRALAPGGDRAVLGPAEDGGYYLVGLKTLHPELFIGIPWSSNQVLAATISAAATLPVACIDQWYDIDAVDDLDRALSSNAPGPEHLQAWARAVRYDARRRPQRTR